MERYNRTDDSRSVLTYIHFNVGRGKVTAAVARNRYVPNLYDVGLSFCSPKDQLKKAKGRELAFNRLRGSWHGEATGVDVMIVRVRPEEFENFAGLRGVVKEAIVNIVLGLEDPNVIVGFDRIPKWATQLPGWDTYNTKACVADLKAYIEAFERARYMDSLPDYVSNYE